MENNSCLSEGTLLQGGKYRIVRFIGAGGFGCTYEAVFESIKARVAIKEFFPHELCNRDATGRMSVGTGSRVDFVDKLRRKFVDEASTLFNFKDLQGIVKVTDVFEENGTSYYVMDYIDGRSLRKIVDTDGPLPEADAVRIIREVGSALEGVHGRNCLHLDIKPDNIMLGADGHPILIDFGVSKQYTREDGCNTSTLMGCTPGYAPLEQMKGNVRSFFPATDVYALGATLYTLLTGHTPPDVSDLINDTETLQFPVGVSSQTRAAIEAAMQVKVKDRPQTVADFLAMLPAFGQNFGQENSRNSGHSFGQENSGNSGHSFGQENSRNSGHSFGQENGRNSGHSFGQENSRNIGHPGTQMLDNMNERKGAKKYLWIAIAAAVAAIIAVVAWQGIQTPTPSSDIIAADTAKVDSVAAVQTAIANAATKPQATDTAEPETQPEPAKPEAKPETQPEPAKPETLAKTEPVAPVTAPASSRTTETAMVAAYTDGGEYRAYTLADWDGFTSAQRAKVTPIGVQLTASGRKFIVAPTDAAGGQRVKWEDKASYDDCVDIPGLRNIESESEVKRDFDGRSNTNAILAYGREHGIDYPAAKAAANYSFKGHKGWYLPAFGQLYLMHENRHAIDGVLAKIGGEFLTYSWSSTEYNSSHAWGVNMADGYVSTYRKTGTSRVRAVAPVPVASAI